MTAAEELVGIDLGNGWVATQRLPKKANESGGYFSVGYIAENKLTGHQGFLKALDYARLLTSADPATVLAAQTNAFNFERDVLRICGARRMSRIVRIIDEGSIIPPGRGPTEVVQYLIFEKADGDARRQADNLKRYDAAWALQTLHQVAVGLRQLHGELIAHQDLKPSNILTFGLENSKIGDLGRAASQHAQAPHENATIAGDSAYAPPEALYKSIPSDWMARRIGCDQYLLGSLFVSFFLGVAITPMIQDALHSDHRANAWNGSYEDAIPYLRQATEDVLVRMSLAMPAELRARDRAEIVQIVRELCEPDLALRGHPADRVGHHQERSLQRYIAQLDRLAKQIGRARPKP